MAPESRLLRHAAPRPLTDQLRAALPLLLLFALLAVGCAPTLQQAPISKVDVQREAEKQKDIALVTWMKRQDRVNRIAWRISRESAGLCPSRRGSYGLHVHNLESYGKEYREAAARHFNIGKPLVVRGLIPDFPAERAGIQVGDTLLAINGNTLEGKTVAQAMNLLKRVDSKKDSARVRVGRLGEVRDVAMLPVTICDYPVQLSQDDVVNAYADGDNVYIASGMVRFAESDDELALVVGHEIAHNALGHVKKRMGNALLGARVDVAFSAGTGVSTQGTFSNAAGQTFSQEFESEADYEGLYFIARAGYDISQAPQFWRRMAAEYPGSIRKNYMASHPSSPERFLRLENAVKEVQSKRDQNQELIPEKIRAKKTSATPGDTTITVRPR